MAEEHEKMFHSIIDKLFYAPKPSSAASRLSLTLLLSLLYLSLSSNFCLRCLAAAKIKVKF
uniref:Uncharacterized protein n=1 Tax=Rhizophora mucronata TaxID=61149 RepID=A0A2P2KTG9_RHIMU